VVISNFIGSPGFAGDHLGFFSHRIGSPGAVGDYLGIPSASRLLGSHHLGFPSHHKTRWVSVAPPALPDLDLGISVAPLALPALGSLWNSSSLSRSVGLVPPVGLGCSSNTARPRRCLSPFGSSRPSQLVWVSCFSHFCSFSLDCFLTIG
jgi:hypothetical protein